MDISQTHGSLLALCITFIVLTTLATGLRFWSRVFQKLPFKYDDWILIPTWLAFLGTCAVVFWALDEGLLGQPSPTDKEVLIEELKPQANQSISFDILSTVAFGLIKLSALFFYRRVFCVPGYPSGFRIYLNVLVGVVCAWLVTFVILPGLQCPGHLDALWSANATDKRQYCTVSANYLLSQSITDVILETIVLFSPMRQIYLLKTTATRRVGIALVFLVGLVSLAACIARLVFYVQLTTASKQNRITDHNLAYTTLIWFSILEAGIALVAVNLPSLYWLKKYGSPEKVIASARSALSLHSIRSKSSKESKKSSAAPSKGPQFDAAQTLGIAKNSDVESTVSSNGQSRQSELTGSSPNQIQPPLPTHAMQVTRTIHQDIDIV